MANLPEEPETGQEIDHLQAEYLERLRHLLRRAPPEIREETLREVQSHIEDEWRALGGGLPALRTVLENLGSPEEYGRDLAFQLILLHGGKRRLLARLAMAAIFWASTSLLGGVVMIVSTLIFGFAIGMIFTAITRAFGSKMMLIDVRNFQYFHHHVGQWSFPPQTWSPLVIGLVGLLPAGIIFAGLFRFFSLWVRSRLGQTGLSLVISEQQPLLPAGWERRAILSMIAFAFLGLTGCLVFTSLGEQIVNVTSGSRALPSNFFHTLAILLGYLSILVFLVSPVLGLLWVAKNSSDHGHSAQ